MASVAPSYRFDLNPPWQELPRLSAIVRAGRAGEYHTAPFVTTLSLKSVSRGVATWSTPRRRYRVDAGSLVLLNQGQTYTLDIQAEDRTGTMALLFEPGLVEDVAPALAQRPDALLESHDDPPDTLEIHERIHPKTGEIAARLAPVEAGLRAGAHDSAWIEHMLAFAAEIVRIDGRARREVRILQPAQREAGRT